MFQQEKALNQSENDVLKQLLNLLKTENLDKWMKKQIKKALQNLTPEMLEEAVKTNQNLTKLFFNHLHLASPKIKPIIKLFLKIEWDTIKSYLSPAKVYKILSEKEDLKPVLEKPETKKYLNREITKLYNAIYEYTFGGENG